MVPLFGWPRYCLALKEVFHLVNQSLPFNYLSHQIFLGQIVFLKNYSPDKLKLTNWLYKTRGQETFLGQIILLNNEILKILIILTLAVSHSFSLMTRKMK